jgi:nucleotide-binding universal stress UspA family protein
MIKTILVAASGTPQTKTALSTAVALARPFGAHLECLHVRRDLTQMLAQAASADLGSGVLMADLLETLKLDDGRRCGISHAAFDDICKRERIPTADRPGNIGQLSACWREESGDETDRIIRRAHAHDLLVIEHPSSAGLSAGVPGSLVIGAGCPVLIAPASPRNDLTETTVVAWKDSSEAARAVTAAMALLAKAKRIVVLTASEALASEAEARLSMEAAVERLRWHGLPAEGRLIATTNALQATMDAVAEINPGLLVMGGYGHGRFREFVFGGFTRHVLAGIATPTLLMH